MRIRGEAYLIMNGWMNFFSLMLACRLGKRPFPLLRGLAASLLGAGYALAAAFRPGLRGVIPLGAAALGMGLICGGAGLCPLIFAGGLMLSGLADFFLDAGMGPGWAMLLSGASALAFCRFLEGLAPPPGRKFRLIIRFRGQSVSLSAIRDSGNLLRDAVTGLPVIAAPRGAFSGLVPDNPEGLSPGFRLLPVKTAAGRGLALCLHPEEIWICRGGRKWRTDAVLALMDFQGPGALLPERLLMQTEEGLHAGL